MSNDFTEEDEYDLAAFMHSDTPVWQTVVLVAAWGLACSIVVGAVIVIGAL